MTIDGPDELAEQLKEDLSEVAQSGSKEFAEEVRSNLLEDIENPEQGEHGLRPYVTEVEMQRDDLGRFTGNFGFDINHPTAELHEFGGPIEPTYSKAKIEGWTRDEFYEALTDCNEIVEKKRLIRSAQLEAKSNTET